MKIELLIMKLKYVILFTALLLFSNFINAQNTLDKIGPSFTPKASVAYSLRLLSSNYTGPLVRIKVGATFYDVYPDDNTKNFSLSSKISAAVTNYNDAVAAVGSNTLSSIITAGSTNATVAIWYDQSGNGIKVLSSVASAKIITAGSIITMNGQPTITFVNNTSFFTSSTTVNYNSQTTATINAVAQNISSIDDYSGIISTGPNGGWGLSYNPNNNTQLVSGIYLYGYFVDGNGGLNASSQELTNTTKVITGLISTSAATSSISINSLIKRSTTQIINPGNGFSDPIFIGKRGNCCANRTFLGNISETMIFPTNLSSADQATLESSQSIFLPPSVSITSSASGTVCAGTNINFTATVTGTTSPTYQWTKNGIAIFGANSSTYSSTTLSNNDQINVWINGGINNANIVSNGLILNLDASNPTSYSGVGNTWYDLSGNNNHATLMNSPAYDATSGSIVTNGSNQYISVPQISTSITNVTMQAWVYVTVPSKGPFIKNGTAGGGYAIGIGSNAYDVSGSNVDMLVYGSPGWINTGQSYGTTGWKLVTMTLDGSSTAKAYVNGTLIGSYTTTPNSTFTGGLNFGANIGDQSNFYNGKFAAAYFYNRALSLAEVQQNYNAFATKSTAYNSNTITVSITGTAPTIATTGDGCLNKTTLSTGSGLSAYAWYKDNVVITGATSNTYTPTESGSYQVQVTSGICSISSTPTTIYTCGRNADGRMTALGSSTTLVSANGAINSGKGVDSRGMILIKPLGPTGTNPITNGLVLYLDATRTASYSGTGTTWNDISGQNNTATLVGNPALSSNPASFTFSTNTYASTAKSDIAMSSATFIAWVNPSQIQTGLTGIIFNRSGNFGSTAPATGLDFSNNNAIGYHWNDLPASYNWNSGITVPINTWSLIALTITSSTATVYLFNASSPLGSSAVNTLTHTALSGLNFIIANEPGGPGRTFLGKIGTSMVYTTALSSADITSIFNAQKAAFGL